MWTTSFAGVPEGDDGEVFGYDLLDFDVVCAAGGLVGGGGGWVRSCVDFGVGVVAAVAAFWGEAGGGVGVAEDVGVFVGADPAEDVELEGSFGDVGVEGAELGGAEG